MKEEYKQALSEVSEILKYTQKDITNKIPQKFREFIEKNKDKEYKITLEDNKSLLEQNIKQETKEIIALIYRDYICEPEERKKIIQETKQQREEIEKEKQEKYKIDFDKLKEQRNQNIYNQTEDKLEEKSLIMLKEEKWYNRMIKKILAIFSRKSK